MNERNNDNRGCGKSVLVGAIAAVTYFGVALCVFSGWAHYRYAGNFSGPLMISTKFGLSDESRAAGAYPIFREPESGWDGQFYYTQCNDPLILQEYSSTTLIDTPSYRFQRNGLPMMACLSSRAFGQQLTTPLWYMLTQLAIVSGGFGILVAFLLYHGKSWAWAFVWAFYAGVLRPMLHGLPDPTADALLLVSVLAALSRHVVAYALFCSLLCLCRESYAAPAAMIWLLTTSHKLDWNNSPNYWYRVVITAMPGVAVVGWAAYVAVQTNTGFLDGSRSVPWGALVDWPFKAFIQASYLDFKAHNYSDVVYATSCATCILYLLCAMVRRAYQSPLALAITPHLILMSMTGWIVWEDGIGFFKNASSVVLLGVILLCYSKSLVLRAVLLLAFATGVPYIYRVDFAHDQFLPPILPQYEVESTIATTELHPLSSEIQYKSQIELLHSGFDTAPYQGIFEWCHRQPYRISVRITNLSNQTWPASSPGKDIISLGRKVMDCQEVLVEDRLPLYKPLGPGQFIDIGFSLPLTKIEDESRHVQLGLVRDGDAWFHFHDATQLIDVPY